MSNDIVQCVGARPASARPAVELKRPTPATAALRYSLRPPTQKHRSSKRRRQLHLSLLPRTVDFEKATTVCCRNEAIKLEWASTGLAGAGEPLTGRFC